MESTSTKSPTSIENQLKSLTQNYDQLKRKLESFQHKHERVMESVLDHLVRQATTLSQYTNVQPLPEIGTVDCINLCSIEYREILQHEHNTPNKWGVVAKNRFAHIVKFIKNYDCNDILDYGAGSANRLSDMLESKYPGKFTCTDYDPGIPEISQKPAPHNLVTCIDVLEHVEPELLNNVLSDLQRVTLKAGFFVVCTTPAERILKNGKNAHLIIETANWWEQKLSEYFDLDFVTKSKFELIVTVNPK